MPQIALRPFMARLSGRTAIPSSISQPQRATIPPQQGPGSSRSFPISAELTQESDSGWETDEHRAALSDERGRHAPIGMPFWDQTMSNPLLRTPFGQVELRPVAPPPGAEGMQT